MILVRWKPFQEITTLSQQVDQIFDELMQARQNSSLPMGNFSGWGPAIEVKEADQEIVLQAEVPGVDAEGLDVQVTCKAVSIAGEHCYEQREEKGRIRSEFRYGRFQRVIPLPAQVQQDKVKAELKNGILTLNLPKVEAEQRKVVKVAIAGTSPTQEASTAQAEGEAEGSSETMAA